MFSARGYIAFCLMLSLNGFGQSDSIQAIKEVKVSFRPANLRLPVSKQYCVDRIDILELAPNDIGELLQRFSGVYLKSYGGLGGMKTFSYRSLGSQHASIILDGFSLENTQAGQVNLAQLHTDNVESIVKTDEQDLAGVLPIAGQLSGVSYAISSFDNSFLKNGLFIRASLGYGSFDTQNSYLNTKWQHNGYFINASGKFRRSDGDYPFRFENGNTIDRQIRTNNAYQDYSFGNAFGYKKKNHQLRLNYRYNESEQGLPGAVIFYNQSADEQLYTKLFNAAGDYSFSGKKLSMRWYNTYTRSYLRYLDTSYLNSAGFLDSEYLNERVNSGIAVNYKFKNPRFNLFGGTELDRSSLISSDSTFGEPLRVYNRQLIGMGAKWVNLNAKLQMGGHYVMDNHELSNERTRYKLTPMFTLGTNYLRPRRFNHRISYRNSLRLPSFNELYYNGVGNIALKPEVAHQSSYELTYEPHKKKFLNSLVANGYFNRVEDLILAIPTKNLFVWSMQNVGIVHVFGFDISSKYLLERDKISYKINLSYSFQRSMDMTDSESPTYRDQIAYIPYHTGLMEFGINLKQSGLRITNSFVGSRYSLNENIEMNRLDPFVITDLSVHHVFKRKNNNLTLQFNIKNLFDRSYAYVRSYIMPGVNYLITLRYALH